MRQTLSLILIVCLTALLFAPFTNAQTANELRVNEPATKLLLRENSTEVSLIVENSGGAVQAKVKLELIAPDGKSSIPAIEKSFTLKSGQNELKIPLAVAPASFQQTDLVWHRLRYEVAAGNAQTAGIIAVSEIAPEVFELKVAAADYFRSPMRYRAQVQAVHPVSGVGIANVKLKGEFYIELKSEPPALAGGSSSDKDEITLNATGETDAEGFATLDFQIPENLKVDDTSLKITGRKNGIIREASDDYLDEYKYNAVYLNTDKPLYQPGQMLQFRALILNTARKIVPSLPLKIEISDPEGQTIHRAEVKTSKFGVAAYSWQIPESARLGSYRIELDSDDLELSNPSRSFKVSRYDLPNFVVNAKPDRQFYLPENETAEIEIRGDYLFGQPVTKAKVRIVQELERTWNYKEQKYDIEEGETKEGELDANGKFIAKFDLKKEQENFEATNYRRFKDLNFAAYITDLSTNRTEQRRFDVRLTKEPIHVYLIESNYNSSAKIAPTFYISTFYADGTPASCEVSLNEAIRQADSEYPYKYDVGKFFTKVQTNSQGVAKLEFPKELLPPDGRILSLFLTAADKDGKRGTTTDEIDYNENPVIKVTTDKTIYRPNEPLKVSLLSSEPNANLFVDVMQNYNVIRSERVRLQNGRAEFSLPYRKDFHDDLIIVAYADFDDEIESGAKTVIYPSGRGLRITAETAKNEFRPGEEAKITFKAVNPKGKTAETALGVVILDKALEERARTDEEFGSSYRDFYDWLGFNSSFAGLTQYELDNLDLRQQISPETELAAEVLLNRNRGFVPEFFRSNDFKEEFQQVFEPYFKQQFAPVNKSLDSAFKSRREYPKDEISLDNLLKRDRIDLSALRDPWGSPYRTSFTIERDFIKLEIWSVSADKKADTKDDLVVFTMKFPYFQPLADKLNQAVIEYHEQTNNFIRDYAALRTQMLKQLDIDIDTWCDLYGNPYRFQFGIEQSNFTIRAWSAGPDGKFDYEKSWPYDDFSLWVNYTDYFTVRRSELSKSLSEYVKQKQAFPKDESEFKAVLKELNFNLDTEKDVFGRQFYLTREESSRYANRVEIQKTEETKMKVKPVTQTLATFRVKSLGADGVQGNYDDFELVGFTGVIGEKSKDGQTPNTAKTQKIITQNGKGAISGIITDANGAVIANATVTAKNNVTTQTVETKTNDEGYFVLNDLGIGNYEIKVTATAFKSSIINNVPVEQNNVTQINITLEVGAVAETVTVSAEPTVVETTLTSAKPKGPISEGVVNGRRISSFYIEAGKNLGKGVRVVTKSDSLEDDFESDAPIETPRLREYFPETLVWSPELITDKNGQAELKFKLADNITTWKIGVIGSNLNGEIGLAEKEIQAFMPFFAEHDPPKFLTEGDEIALPVVLRNYLAQPQSVSVTMKEESWFKLLSPANQKITVAPGDSTNAIFNFRAVDYIKDGKQRVTALANDASDAIEKPVTVRPNGQETVRTEGKIFREAAVFDVNFPPEALPKTQTAELKIYPNLTAHIAESVEGILRRPYGCAEQTISSAYPSLLWLKLNRNSDNPLKVKAKRYLTQAAQRLPGYQKADGSFGYWSNDTSNFTLTAYALRFLTEAGEFIEIDPKVAEKTYDFLKKSQRADGSWPQIYYWDNVENPDGTKQTTAYVARVLAIYAKTNADSKQVVQKALGYLKPKMAEIDEPYSLAGFALTAFDAGETETALKTVERLRTLSKAEGTGVYWNLETNTPFYGWGYVGRIETTALVAQALLKTRQDKQNDELLNKALQFLLKAKDRYGVWYSTQATVNVLDALILALATDSSNSSTVQPKAEIYLNGNKLQEINLPKPNEITNPVFIKLPNLSASNNHVEIRQNSASPYTMAQIVANHYVGWANANNLNFSSNDSRGLSLKVNFDKTTAKIGEEITCRVEAERSGFQGYGMLLAEIGLPPGADVDRESLEKAREADWRFSRYDVLPDRIIVYLWAEAGGNKFSFKFKPRYGLEANNAVSTIYDYYNPEANATVAPTRFIVR